MSRWLLMNSGVHKRAVGCVIASVVDRNPSYSLAVEIAGVNFCTPLARSINVDTAKQRASREARKVSRALGVDPK